jgi:hypothetical protein
MSNINSLFDRIKPKCCMALSILGVLCLSIGIVKSKFEIGSFGLINGIDATIICSISFFIIAIIVNAISSDQHMCRVCVITSLVGIICAFYLIPFILEGTARMRVVYYHLSIVDFITNNHHLLSNDMYAFAWPGSYILGSIFLQITGISSQIFAGVFPVAYMLIASILIWVISGLVSKAQSFTFSSISCLIFIVIGWTDQGFFGDQSLGIILLLSFILLTQLYRANPLINFGTIMFIVLIALVETHALTFFITTIWIIVLWIIQIAFKSERQKRITIIWPVTMLLLFIGWNTYFALKYGAWQYVLKVYMNHLFDVSYKINLNFLRYTNIPGFIQVIISRTNIIASVIVGIAALIGIWVSIKRKIAISMDMCLMGIFIAAASTFFLFPYGGEILFRIFLFSSVGFAYFITRIIIIKYMRISILALLILLIIPHFFIQYGYENIKYVKPSEIIAGQFYKTKNIHGGLEMGWIPVGGIALMGYEPLLVENQITSKYTNLISLIENKQPVQIGFCPGLQQVYSTFWDIPNELANTIRWLDQTSTYTSTYTNSGGVVIYTNFN